MKTDFPIFWIDDNTDFLDSIRDEITSHAHDSHGLKIDVVFQDKPKGAIDLIRKINPYLVVVDYKLGEQMKGDAFINELRKNQLFHDVLFYTTDGFSSEQLKLFFANPTTGLAMGVHFADKKFARDRLCKIIDLKNTQVSDLATQRGWIVADAIELEHELSDLLAELSETIHTSFGRTVNRLLDSDRVDFGCRSTLMNGVLKDLMKYVNSVDPKNKLIADLATIKSTMATFTEEIIEIRNSIAHQKHDESVPGKITITTRQSGKEPIVFDATFVKNVRTNIHKHQKNLLALRKLIASSIAPFCSQVRQRK